MKPPGDYMYRLPGQPVRHSGKLAFLFFLLTLLVLLITAGCGSVPGDGPTGPSSGDPREEHIVSETARFASLLGVRVRGVVTDEKYMVPAARPLYEGEKVPAAGWYADGIAHYYRPVVVERSLEYGSALAAHEVSHSLFEGEAEANACAAILLTGRTCR